MWLTGRMLGYLVAVCRTDHRSPLADADIGARSRVLTAVKRRYRAGERDPGRLGGEIFARIMAERGFGRGRGLLAVVATLVFWELNGFEVEAMPNSLVKLTRHVARKGNGVARVAELFRERARPVGRY